MGCGTSSGACGASQPQGQAAPAGLHTSWDSSEVAISLQQLLTFSSSIPPTWSTSDVVTNIIVPKTAAAACRYADLLPDGVVGKPMYFASHRWATPFSQLVASVSSFLAGAVASEVFIWVDIFAINQHADADTMKQSLEKLQVSIRDAPGGTLVVVDPAGELLRRVWCLYELWQTILLRGANKLQLLTGDVDTTRLAQVVQELDVRNSQATKPSDKDDILAAIEGSIGVDAFNAGIRQLFMLQPLDTAADIAMLRSPPGSGEEVAGSAVARVSEWLERPQDWSPGHRTMALIGAQGTGKSAVMAALAERAKQQPGQATACLFCKYNDVQRQDPIRAVKTLAYQLAEAIPSLRPTFQALAVTDIRMIGSPKEAFDKLLQDPLKQVGDDLPRVLLLLDGLDEGGAETLFNGLFSLVRQHLSELPGAVRIVVSLRSDSPTAQSFLASLQPTVIEMTQLGVEAAAQQLLQSHLPPNAPPEVKEQGGTSLLYAKLLPDLLAGDGGAAAAAPGDLGALFEAVVRRHLAGLPQGQRGLVLSMLEAVAAAGEPLSLAQLQTLLQAEAPAGTEVPSVQQELVQHLGQLLTVVDYKVHLVHQAFADWLASDAGRETLSIDLHKGHARLAAHAVRALAPGGKPHPYHLRYAIMHLCRAGEVSLLEQLVVRLDFWHKAYRAGLGDEALKDLGTMMPSPAPAACAEVLRWLQRDNVCLVPHPDAVWQLAAHTPLGSVPQHAALQSPDPESSDLGGSSARVSTTLINTPEAWPLQVAEVALNWSGSAPTVSFSHDGLLMAYGSSDAGVVLVDAHSWQEVAELPCKLLGDWSRPSIKQVAFSADGAYVAAWCGSDGLRLFSTARAQLLTATISGTSTYFTPGGDKQRPAPAYGMAFTADSRRLAWGSATGIGLYDIAAEETAETLTADGLARPDTMAVSPDGVWLAADGTGGEVHLFNLTTGKHVAALELNSSKRRVGTLAFSHDSRRLAADDGATCVKILDVPSGSVLSNLSGHEYGIQFVAFMPPSKATALEVIATSDGYELLLWDTTSGNKLDKLPTHGDGVGGMAWQPGPTPRLVISSQVEGLCTISVWDVAPLLGEARQNGPRPTALSFNETNHPASMSADGALLASVCREADELAVLAWGTAGSVERLARIPGPASALAVSPDGKLVAIGWSDGRTQLWDVASQQLLPDMEGWGPPEDKEVDNDPNVNALAFSNQGRLLAGSYVRTIRIWDVETHALVGSWAAAAWEEEWDFVTKHLAFSPDDQLLASGDSWGGVHLWSVSEPGQEPVSIHGHNHEASLRSLAWAPGGKMLATNDIDSRVRLWDPASGAQLLELQGRGDLPVFFGGSLGLWSDYHMTFYALDEASGLPDMTNVRGRVYSPVQAATSLLLRGGRLVIRSANELHVYGISAGS